MEYFYMQNKEKAYSLKRVELMADSVLLMGDKATDEAISIIGKTIDRSNCGDTITACEKLIEVLNEGPEIRTINQLTKEQSRFAAQLLAAIYDCLTLHV